MSLLAVSTGFQHRCSHSPSPIDMLALHSAASKHASTIGPLTPPLTSASPHSSDTDASPRSLHIPATDITFTSFDSCRAFQQSPKWSSSPDQSAMPSPSSPTRSYGELDLSEPTHFLFVSGVPKNATTHSLKQAFVACGNLKGIFTRFQADYGAIILAFYDIRHTLHALRAISSSTRPFLPGSTRLGEARFVTPEDLHSLIGHSPFVNATNGSLRITTSPAGQRGELDGPALQSVLAGLGEVRVFSTINASTYRVEFFDARDATIVLVALNGRVILQQRLHIVPYSVSTPDPGPPNHEDADAQNKNTVSFPST